VVGGQMAVYKPSGLQVLRGAMFHQRTVLTLLKRDAAAAAARGEEAPGAQVREPSWDRPGVCHASAGFGKAKKDLYGALIAQFYPA
jgi:hypothetical protein